MMLPSQSDKNFVRVKTENLKVGMYVVDTGRGWLKHPWLTKNRLIKSGKDIRILRRHGIMEVVIDVARSTGAQTITSEIREPERPTQQTEEKPEAITEKPRPPADDPVSLREELPKAFEAYGNALNSVKAFVSHIRAGRDFEVGKVEESVNGIVESVFRNSDACLTLIKLRSYDQYTFTHCLNVAVLAVTMGRHLLMTREDIFELGIGGIFHDIGKLRIPNEILNKPGKLNEEELKVMKIHAALGAYMLEERIRNISQNVYDMVYHHHERLDGSGYPAQIKGSEIDGNAVICSLADVYDALTSERVYHAGIPPHEALRVLFDARGRHFPQEYVDRFIRCIGIYPAGSTVKLNTREVAVVVAVNHTDLLHPTVRIVINRDGYRLDSRKEVDLAGGSCMGRHIVGVMDHMTLGIDPGKAFNSMNI